MTTYATQTTINDIPPLTHIISGASQTVFNTNWTADADTDVVVFVTPGNGAPSDATQIVSTSDYVVTFIGASQTVRVTFNSAQTLGDLITITRLTPASRLNLYTNTNFAPTMLNQDVGILTLVDQQAQLVNQYVAPRYNYTAQPVEVEDTILPVLEANQIWAKNNANNAIIAYDVPASGGVAPKTAAYLIQTATSELPNAQVMGSLASGFVVNTAATGVQLTRTIAGTTNQVDVANATGIAGNPTFSLSSTLNAPGTFNIQSSTAVDEIIDDSTMATATATNLSTSAAIKAYVDGLDAGNVKSVSGTANRITSTGGVNPVIDIAATYVGQTSITTLGTIGTGTWQGSVIGSTYGGTGVNNAGSTLTVGGNFVMLGAYTFDGTLTGNTALTFPTTGTLATTSQIPTGAALTRTDDTNVTLTLGGSPATALVNAASLTLGWTGTLSGTRGGTGVNNGASTITIGGNFEMSGAYTFTGTLTGNTAITFPTSGTLLTSAGAVTSLSGTANQITASASTGAVTLAIASNPVLPGTGGVTLPTGNTAQQAGSAGTMRFNSQTSVFEGTVDGATWSPFSTAAGTVVSVSGTAGRITSTGGTTPVIDIDATYAGQNSITTLGTVATGTWNATAVDVAYGGTSKTSFTAYAPIFGGTTSTGALQQTAALTDGQLIIGSTGALPSVATLTAGTGISITNGAGSVTIASTGGGTDAAFSFMIMGG